MIKTLQMLNFRQHRDTTMSFESGFNLIKGNNEAGKTTALEAISYGLFGAKALRQAVDQVVTWGEPVASLKVILTFDFQGVQYTVTRGKSGAEIRFGSELITGQTETVKFVEGLFNANASVCGSLMLAPQGSIRGALAGGPKATMELIEQLADFDLIENLILKIQEKLPSGNTALVESRIKSLESTEEPVKPEVSGLEAKVAALKAEVNQARDLLSELEQKRSPLQQAKKQGMEDYNNFLFLSEKVAQWPKMEASQLEQIEDLKRQIASITLLSDEQVKAFESQIEQAQKFETLNKAYLEVSKVASRQAEAHKFAGNLESLKLALSQTTAQVNKLLAELSDAMSAKKVLEAQLITETACGLCGKDLSEVPEVIEKNRATKEKIEQVEQRIDGLKADLATVNLDLAGYQKVDYAPIHRVCERHHQYITVDKTVVPWGLQWNGEKPVEVDCGEAQAQLQAHKSNTAKLNRLQGNLEGCQERLESDRKTVQEYQKTTSQLEPKVAAWVEQVTKPLEELENEFAETAKRMSRLHTDEQQASSELSQVLSDYASKHRQWGTTQDQLAQAKAELAAMNFNNALIKKIRSARPKIADKLWAVVLAAVSHYFSEIRGVRSTVSKSEAGFQVDGHPVEGLSGSTLDALGLSVRIALTKTFLPNIRFMLLDEAGAACDSERESNMLGVLSSCDFDQVIHVSHSEVGDAFAAHLVAL